MEKPVVILRAGDAAAPVAARRGEFAAWIVRAARDAWPGPWVVHDVRTDAPLPEVTDAAAFVMTGSSSSVTERAPWMLRAEEHIRAIAREGTPFFGICFGHQLAAQALGGEVTKNPRGREIGTVRVRRVADDALFEATPTDLDVNATHVDSVARLPPGARLLAESDLDPVQAFAVGAAIRCVQFHPEFDGDVMRGYVSARAHLVAAEGLDAKAIEARAKDAPDAEALLRSFLQRFVTAG